MYQCWASLPRFCRRRAASWAALSAAAVFGSSLVFVPFLPPFFEPFPVFFFLPLRSMPSTSQSDIPFTTASYNELLSAMSYYRLDMSRWPLTNQHLHDNQNPTWITCVTPPTISDRDARVNTSNNEYATIFVVYGVFSSLVEALPLILSVNMTLMHTAKTEIWFIITSI